MGKYQIERDKISWTTGFFRKKKGEIGTEKIIAVLPYKKGFFRAHRVKIYSGENQIHEVDFKINKNLASHLIKSLKVNAVSTLYSSRLKRVLSVKNNIANDIEKGNYHKIKSEQLLYCYDTFTLFVDTEKEETERHIIKYDEVVFFRNNKNGSKQEVYFGSNSNAQATLKLASKNDVEYLKDLIMSQNSIINFSEGENVKEYEHTFSLVDIFHPSRWNTKERVIMRESGILFEQKKGKKIDTIYLPYDEINSHSMKNNILTGRLVVYGSQNIIAKRRFPKSVISQLQKDFKERNMKAIKGSTCMNYFCLCGIIPIFKRKNRGKIVYNDEGISIKPSKDFKKRHKGQKVKLDFLYDEVSIKFEKYKPLSPRRNVSISPKSDSNIRSDQTNKSHTFTFVGFNKTDGLRKAYNKH